MDYRTLLEFMSVAEKLKCRTRHSWTSDGRQESVAEHTYRLLVFAWLVRDELPECNMEKIMKMCLFHDIGEAVTGDIPCFEKREEDRKKEYMLLGLRTIEGVSISKFKEKYIDNPIFLFRKELEKLVEEKLIMIDGNYIRLTNKGLDLANLVWEEFI